MYRNQITRHPTEFAPIKFFANTNRTTIRYTILVFVHTDQESLKAQENPTSTNGGVQYRQMKVNVAHYEASRINWEVVDTMYVGFAKVRAWFNAPDKNFTHRGGGGPGYTRECTAAASRKAFMYAYRSGIGELCTSYNNSTWYTAVVPVKPSNTVTQQC